MNRVVLFLALAALVCIGRPDTALAATLSFSQSGTSVNTLPISIAGPGSTTSTVVTVASTGTLGTLNVTGYATSDGTNWLCAIPSGSMLTVYIGSSCTGASSTQLHANTSYNGNVLVSDSNGATGNLSVILTVQNSSGGTNGLVASQNPVIFNVPSGSSTQSQTVNITFNGNAQTVTSVSTSTNSLSPWLQAFNQGTSVLVSVTPASLTSTTGSDTGTVTVVTPVGNLSVTVNLTVGGGGTTGLSASPNPLTFTVATGTGSTSLPVNITYNGSPISSTVSNISTNTGGNWLSAFSSGSTINVTVNPSILTAGTYSGTVTVLTSVGSLNFPVNIIVGGSSSGLVATPNPLSINVPFGSSAVTQNVNITFNGAPAVITGVSASTTSGQNWIQASSGQNQGTVSVSANPSGLSGSYFGTVTVNTTVGTVTFNVNLTVGAGNSSGLVASPTSVTFNLALVGSGAPSQNVNITYNGAAATIQSIMTNVNGTWLLASNTAPGVVTVGINGVSLTMGSYSGTVTVNTTAGSLTFQVNANVGQGGGSSGLAVTPSPLALNLPVGTGVTTQNVNVTFNGSPVMVNSVSTSTTNGQNWLQASTTSTTGAVAITVNPNTLPAGSYSGTVTINTPSGPTSLVVNLTVGSGGTTGLAATPSVVTLTGATGGTTPAQNVAITLNGSPVTINSVNTSTTTNQNWLLAAPSTTVQGAVIVNTNLTGLAAGTYTGTVTVNTLSGTVSFQVTLMVGGGVTGNGLIVTPNPVSFTETSPGTAGPQIVSVTLNGAPQAIQSATFAPSLPGLTFINTQYNADGTATFTVNGVVTMQGTYTGTLTLYLTSGGSVAVPVTLTFGSGGGTGALAAAPSPVNFNIPIGSGASTQNISITFNGAPATISNVNTSTTGGQNWLQAATTGALGGVTVTANPFGLTGGSYTGTVLVTTTSGALSVPVNLTVGGSGQTTITLSSTSLSFAYQTGQAQPASQSITLTAPGGAQVPFTAVATTNTTPSWLSIVPSSGTVGSGIAPSSITATVNAAGLAAGTYTGAITITPSGGAPQTVTVTLTVTAPVVTTPTVVAIQNAASSIPTSLSPGLNILIYGTNMGPATLTPFVVGANGTLSTNVAGTQVTFDGIPAAIIYTRNTLVSVMVPYEVAGRVSTSLVVTYNGASSTPLQLRVVDTVPGIYSLTQTGSGQGAILNQNGTVNGAGNPESTGNYIQIFGTGEGQTSPAGVDGAILPNRLPLPVPTAPASVTIGGITVPASDINYAGEAPGLVSGVFQVNAKIPAGVGPGAVPVVVRWGGAASQANVTVSVR